MAVVRNLIENAIQSLDNDGAVKIAAWFQESPLEPCVRIEISDTGCGIAKDIITDVMEPFFTTRTKGTGLGLAIVKGIVERHGGVISLTSRVGEGTQVSFTLPTSQSDA